MSDSPFLGEDLHLGLIADEEGRYFAGPHTRIDLQGIPRQDVSPRTTDLGRVSGKANLVQSLILRVKTERGELEALGHPTYGSRHHQLIGEPNTESNRNLLKLYMIECLRQEPRLESIESIEVLPGEGLARRDSVRVYATLLVKGFSDPLNLVIPFSFEEPLG